MLELITKTQRGTKVRLTANALGNITMHLPQGSGKAYWGSINGNEGLIANIANGNASRVCATIPRLDYDKIRKMATKMFEKNVPGFDILREAINDQTRYCEEFERMMEDGDNDGANSPESAKGNITAIKNQYPVAAAFILAESYELANNYAKSGAGSRAKEKIANGEDYNAAIEEMEKEWSKHCAEAIWN